MGVWNLFWKFKNELFSQNFKYNINLLVKIFITTFSVNTFVFNLMVTFLRVWPQVAPEWPFAYKKILVTYFLHRNLIYKPRLRKIIIDSTKKPICRLAMRKIGRTWSWTIWYWNMQKKLDNVRFLTTYPITTFCIVDIDTRCCGHLTLLFLISFFSSDFRTNGHDEGRGQ